MSKLNRMRSEDMLEQQLEEWCWNWELWDDDDVCLFSACWLSSCLELLEGEPFNDDFSVPVHQKHHRVQIDLG